MSERGKGIVTICLIAGGLVLIGYNFLHSSQPKVHGRKVEQKVNLDVLRKIEASEPISMNKAEVLALFVLKSDVCSPCVNNTFDYIHLMDNLKRQDIQISALFMENDLLKVHRFMKVTKLPLPYRRATRNKLPVILQNALQELVLIDIESGKIFYRLMIPGNVTTNLKYKREVLEQAFSHWEDI